MKCTALARYRQTRFPVIVTLAVLIAAFRTT